jgi:hypothetical protein
LTGENLKKSCKLFKRYVVAKLPNELGLRSRAYKRLSGHDKCVKRIPWYRNWRNNRGHNQLVDLQSTKTHFKQAGSHPEANQSHKRSSGNDVEAT